MEWVILFAIVVACSSISSKLDKIINMQSPNHKRDFPSLKNLIGENISLQMNDDFDVDITYKTSGILKEFNDKWLVIEVINKDMKKELFYYRINDIVSIDILDKE